jgi:hypothetical protein
MRTLIAAAALFAATGAYAQKTYPPHVDMPAGAELGSTQPANNDGTTVASNAIPELLEKASPKVLEQYSTTAPTATGVPVSGRVAEPPPMVTTNGPVFDTPETRKLYPPLSRAGRRTAAAGN